MTRAVWLAMAAVGLGGCAAEASGPDVAEGAESALIGGVDVRSPALDAVGVLLAEDPRSGAKDSLCTATLISPTHVLTAKHCAVAQLAAQSPDGRDHFYTEYASIFFAIGNDASTPSRRFKAASVKVAELATGGVGYGSDVAIYTLEAPATGVTPIPVARTPLASSDIGKVFNAIGYGVRDASGSRGHRTLGNITLSHVDGKPYQAAFGTYEAFAQNILGRPPTLEEEPFVRALWEQPLLAEHEAYFAAKEGDAQACSGDSGGPLLRKVGGKLEVFGVASWVPEKSTTSLLCARGVIYATFGPSARALIDDPGTATPGPSPCGAETIAGRCDGDTVVRCLGASEGGPRTTRTNCKELDLVCRVGEDGAAACEAP